jgi:RNA polymerase sigma-70 factor (ECF subfamily)
VIWDRAIPEVNARAAAEDAAGKDRLPMDEAAFAAFYQQTSRALWAYLARVSGNAALADDLSQESYLRFLCADRRGEGDAAARGYLFRIATNLMHDHWRRPRTTELEAIPEAALAPADNRDLRRVDSQAVLGPGLALMKPRERQLLWLAYAEGYTHREIAEIMGLGAMSIRLLLFRAKRKLAGLLREAAAKPGRSK